MIQPSNDQSGGAMVTPWKVTGVTDTMVPDPAQGYVKGKRVTVTVYDGTTFTVDIPLSQFNDAAVRARIEEQFLHEDNVRNLQAEPVYVPPAQQQR